MKSAAEVIGVTGSMQSGKQELGPVFERLGFNFLDLNRFADKARAEGSPSRPAYEELGLGPHLYPDGRERMSFFEEIIRRPELHRATMEIDLAAVRKGVHSALMVEQRPIVISWGYVYQLLDDIPLDFVLVFRTTPDVWFERIRKAATRRGGENSPLRAGEILRLAKLTEMLPGPILDAVMTKMGSHFAVVDTSADDWGEMALIAKLGELGWVRP